MFKKVLEDFWQPPHTSNEMEKKNRTIIKLAALIDDQQTVQKQLFVYKKFIKFMIKRYILRM